MSDLLEIKKVIEAQGSAWEEFKKANDELLKAKADGKAVGDLETKLAKISDDMDKLAELKSEFDEVLKKLNRPENGNTKGESDLQVEAKNFNAMLRADLQAKGRPFAEVDADAYQQYKSGFFKLVRTGNLESLTSDERKAMSVGSDPDGGYLIPAPTAGRIVSKVYEQSVIRQLANVVTISTNELEGIVDNDEAEAGWVGEIDARNDTATPQVGKYRIEAHEMYAQPKFTQKLIDDAAVDIEAWLAGKVADKFARVEGAAFMTGNGVGKPRGIFAYPTAATADSARAWGTIQHIATGASGAWHTTKFDPLFDAIAALQPQYLQNATFVMRREVRTKIRKMKEATSDRYLWEPSLQAGQPDRLLGYAARVDQYAPALDTGSLSLAFGDFREAYTIVDRIGVRVLRDPYTAKPYIRFYSTRRTGGGAVNFEAVKFLQFAS